LVAAAAAAVGTDGLASIKCSTTVWTKQQVDAAVAEGCRLQKANTPIGRSSYPHKFNNYEKLVFAAASPYFEFPIVLNGIYAGGAPGADRVVFNPDLNNSCVYVGAMTHSGASGNGFLSCSEKRDGSGSPSSTESKTKTKTTGTATKTTTGTAQTTLETTAKPDTTGSAQ
ncbi:Ribonuclease/ribotoxin, partial [Lasiosphaeria miniovina]